MIYESNNDKAYKAHIEAIMKMKEMILYYVKANGRTDEIMYAQKCIQNDYKNINEGAI